MTQNLVAEYTNACTCVTYNDDSGDWEEAPECWGDCWQDQIEDFAYIVQDIIDHSNTFKIKGFPVWYGTTGGMFDAENAEELLLAITPRNTEWRLQVTGNLYHLTGILSHHDGTGTITVTPIID
jgi:hypothetical protein